ncbi:MAG: acyl-CoA dehydrogenase family protein [Gammaproteobacteria bacterium]|nr:acyl-CoA dehydrogenase family protein [Gammaproteobacteria bacterium]MBQ0839572.1 acyl-CoA dehydrogenase family protein [Gammaproteobacteria bacterium]
MALVLSEEQQLLKNSAREFVKANFPVDQVRQLRDGGDPLCYCRELWQQMAALGWAGIIFPEEYGGLGLGYAELGVVLEELGRALAAQPFLSTVLLAGNTLLLGGSEAQKQRWLPGICAGESTLALAFQESGRFSPWQVETRAEVVADGFCISGEKRFVLGACGADQLLVLARTSGASGEKEGLSLFLMAPDTPGLETTPQRLLDSRNAAVLNFDKATVPASQLLGELGKAAEILDIVFDCASAGLNAELLGTLSEAFERTLDYLKTRQQFGALIGSFQALKHRAADMFCECELAASLTLEALRALDERRDDMPLMVSAAKARTADVANLIGRESVQMFGGIGMTDEEDIGLYMKRARVAEITLGDSSYHRERFASLSGF